MELSTLTKDSNQAGAVENGKSPQLLSKDDKMAMNNRVMLKLKVLHKLYKPQYHTPPTTSTDSNEPEKWDIGTVAQVKFSNTYLLKKKSVVATTQDAESQSKEINIKMSLPNETFSEGMFVRAKITGFDNGMYTLECVDGPYSSDEIAASGRKLKFGGEDRNAKYVMENVKAEFISVDM
jgi:hypothetical protein